MWQNPYQPSAAAWMSWRVDRAQPQRAPPLPMRPQRVPLLWVERPPMQRAPPVPERNFPDGMSRAIPTDALLHNGSMLEIRLHDFDDIDDAASTVAPPLGFQDNAPVRDLLAPRRRERELLSEEVDSLADQFGDMTIASVQTLVSNVSRVGTDDFPNGSPPKEQNFPNWILETLYMVPEDMAHYKDKFPERKMKALKEKYWTVIYITEIHSPHKFWYQTEKQQRQLNDLMDKLRDMYSRESNDYLTVKEHQVKVNLLVAALYDGYWHRARIISTTFIYDKKPAVKLFYVDYGTVASVWLQDVRFLHRKFLGEPELCHRGSLSGVLPMGHAWSERATEVFLFHVRDRPVLACELKYRPEDRSSHVEISDPATSDPIINVNHVLMQENLSRDYDAEDLTEYLAFYAQELPTFDDLETGLHPTYSLLIHYRAVGIPILPRFAFAEEPVVQELVEEAEEEWEGAVGGAVGGAEVDEWEGAVGGAVGGHDVTTSLLNFGDTNRFWEEYPKARNDARLLPPPPRGGLIPIDAPNDLSSTKTINVPPANWNIPVERKRRRRRRRKRLFD